MLDESYLISLYEEGKLKYFVDLMIYSAAHQRQLYFYDKKYIELEKCFAYVKRNLVKPNIDITKCLQKIDLALSNSNITLLEKNLLIKKQKYFRSLFRINSSHAYYKLLLNLNWVALNIDGISEWKEFISHLTLVTPEVTIRNTRKPNGFKPYMISSKIIFNRNGSK